MLRREWESVEKIDSQGQNLPVLRAQSERKSALGEMGGDGVTDGVASSVTFYKEGFGDKRGLGPAENSVIFQGAIPVEPPECAFSLFPSLFLEKCRNKLPSWAINKESSVCQLLCRL